LTFIIGTNSKLTSSIIHCPDPWSNEKRYIVIYVKIIDYQVPITYSYLDWREYSFLLNLTRFYGLLSLAKQVNGFKSLLLINIKGTRNIPWCYQTVWYRVKFEIINYFSKTRHSYRWCQITIINFGKQYRIFIVDHFFFFTKKLFKLK